MRIYVPLTVADLEEFQREDRLAGDDETPLLLHAVTATLRAKNPDDDEDDLEYEAMLDAAFTSAWLAAEQAGMAETGQFRAIVAAADLKDGLATEVGEGTLFSLAGIVNAKQLVSVHISAEDIAIDGSDDVEPELLWFDRTEIGTGLEYLRGQ